MTEEKKSNEKHVTELADEKTDRWVSVTDASRIARIQEVTIRRWIESGKLPVHPERIGINKRTRQIRLSDLVKLTPIIDPEAAITSDRGLLDLPSIPKEMKKLSEQMVALQQEITAQMGTLSEQHGQFATETRQSLTTHQEQLGDQGRSIQQAATSLQRVEAAIADLQQKFAEASRQILDLTGELPHVRQELIDQLGQAEQSLRLWATEQIAASEAQISRTITALTTQLSETEQALRQESAEALSKVRQTIARLDERVTSVVGELNGAIGKQDEYLRTLIEVRETAHEHLKASHELKFAEQGKLIVQLQFLTKAQAEALEAMKKQAETAEKDASQLRLDLNGQMKNQQALQRQLDEERQARLALAKQVEKLLQGQRKGKTSE